MTVMQVRSTIYIAFGKLNINSALRGMSTSDNEANEPREDGGGSW